MHSDEVRADDVPVDVLQRERQVVESVQPVLEKSNEVIGVPGADPRHGELCSGRFGRSSHIMSFHKLSNEGGVPAPLVDTLRGDPLCRMDDRKVFVVGRRAAADAAMRLVA
jgi:hypothetical protein